MKQYQWPEMVEAHNTCPDVKEGMPDFISMKGAMEVCVPKKDTLPQSWYDATAEMERGFGEAYKSMRVVGEENANVLWSEYPGMRYLGNIYGRNGSDVLFRINMNGAAASDGFPIDTLITFFGVFPLGEHANQTQTALRGIWKHIKGFDYIFPPSNDSPIPKDKQGSCSVLLVRGGKPVASGEHAILEARLEPKKIILMSGGMQI